MGEWGTVRSEEEIIWDLEQPKKISFIFEEEETICWEWKRYYENLYWRGNLVKFGENKTIFDIKGKEEIMKKDESKQHSECRKTLLWRGNLILQYFDKVWLYKWKDAEQRNSSLPCHWKTQSNHMFRH